MRSSTCVLVLDVLELDEGIGIEENKCSKCHKQASLCLNELKSGTSIVMELALTSRFAIFFAFFCRVRFIVF